VEISLGGIAGIVSRRRGDPPYRSGAGIGGSQRYCRTRFFNMPGFWLDRRGPYGTRLKLSLAALLFLDPGQNLPETLVLDNGGMIDRRQLVEGGPAFPEPPAAHPENHRYRPFL
jgi:hypothetical protein